MRLQFNEYSDSLQEKFTEDKFAQFSKLCVDTARRNVEGLTLASANQTINSTIREMCGLGENPTQKQIKKAFNKTAVREAVFDIIQETIEDTLVTGWQNDPFFNRFVDLKTFALGDKNLFYMKDPSIVTVAQIADGHHSLERQRLGIGRELSVPIKS